MASPARTVLITGCSSGIGRATAQLLAESDFRVLAGVRKESDGNELSASVSKNVEPIVLDVTSADAVDRATKHVEATSPNGLFALINNAGMGLPSAVELTTPDELRTLLEVNTIGPLQLIQNCLPLLRRGGGRIINISSLNGRMALPMVGAYSASKFALEALSDTLRVELRPWRIPVSIVRPGQVRTPIFDKAREAIIKRQREIPPELKPGYDELYARTAEFNERGAKSRTSPEDVAAVVLRALTATNPKPHYHVGIDAHLMRRLNAYLPQRLIDRLLARVMGVLKPLE